MRLAFLLCAAAAAGILLITICEAFTPQEGVGRDPETATRVREIKRVTAERFQAVDLLLERQINFAQAASRFQQLSAELPDDSLTWLQHQFPHASCDSELHFRHVLYYCEARVDRRGAGEAVPAALRKELEDRQLSGRWSLEEISARGLE